MSVVGESSGAVGEAAVVNAAIDLTQAFLNQEAERVRALEVPVDVRLGRGIPVDELNKASTLFDLLVIGSDYRARDSGMRREVRGIRIVAGAHCPVAVVPDIDLSARRGVVVGVDGSPTSERAIDFAAAEANRSGESLTAVSTWTTVPLPVGMRSYPSDYLLSMQSLADEALAISLAGIMQNFPDLVVHRVVERGYPAATINRLAADARMAVVGSHGRGAVARFILGSTSREVLAHIATATVVVR